MNMVDEVNTNERRKKQRKNEMKAVLRLKHIKECESVKENKFSRHNKNTEVQNMKRVEMCGFAQFQ